jgi:hypothetical protein
MKVLNWMRKQTVVCREHSNFFLFLISASLLNMVSGLLVIDLYFQK